MKLWSARLALGAVALSVLGLVACGGSSGTSNSPTPGVSGVHSAYVANAGAGTISEYAIDSNGKLTEIPGSPFSISANATALQMTPNGNFLYALDPAKNTIVEMSINSTSGVLTIVGTQTTTSTPSSLTVDNSGKFLYVGNSGANNISVYAIGADGKLTEASFSPVAVNGPVKSVVVSPKGGFLFATIPSTGSIYEFKLDTTTGALTPNAGSPIMIGTTPRYVAVDTNETFVIVIDQSGLINRANMDSTGALTIAPFSPFTANTDPAYATVNGGYVYVLSGNGKVITTLSFQSNGAPFQVSATQLGNGPNAMSISGNFLYATNAGDNTVSQFSLSAGVATVLSPTTVTSGTTPDAIAVR